MPADMSIRVTWEAAQQEGQRAVALCWCSSSPLIFTKLLPVPADVSHPANFSKVRHFHSGHLRLGSAPSGIVHRPVTCANG